MHMQSGVQKSSSAPVYVVKIRRRHKELVSTCGTLALSTLLCSVKEFNLWQTLKVRTAHCFEVRIFSVSPDARYRL